MAEHGSEHQCRDSARFKQTGNTAKTHGRDGDLSQPENAWPLQHLVEAIANEVQARLLGQAGKNPPDLNCATFAASPAPFGDGATEYDRLTERLRFVESKSKISSRTGVFLRAHRP